LSEFNIGNSNILPQKEKHEDFDSKEQSDHGSISNVSISTKTQVDQIDDPILTNQLETRDLVGKFRQANSLWWASANSMKQITARLMDESSTSGRLEGKMSVKAQTDLYAKVDEFLEEQSIARPKSQSNDLDYLFGNSDVDEPYDDAQVRMQKEFGDWYDDDYVWSPEHGQAAVLRSIPFQEFEEEAEEEPIEYALRRIDREWGQTE
jgi:hypothetical protein